MSNINTAITNESVIPYIDSKLFQEKYNSKHTFAVGMLAVGNEVLMPEEYLGYLKLRASVYGEQTNMISLEDVRDDGTESDPDDDRSIHFGVIENCNNKARVVGAMRLIVKSNLDSAPLPIEVFYPGIFKDSPIQLNAIEVSRYITRHEDPKEQSRLKWKLYPCVLAHIILKNYGPTYAVVEEPLERGLTNSGVPLKRLQDPIYVPEYSAENMPIVINTQKMAKDIRHSDPMAFEQHRKEPTSFIYY